MTINNDILYNEAYSAFLASSNAQNAISERAMLGALAVIFATQVDAGILNDDSISDDGGVALSPINATIQQDQLAKTSALYACCIAVLSTSGVSGGAFLGGAAPPTGRGSSFAGNHAGGSNAWIATAAENAVGLYSQAITDILLR